MKDYKFNDYGVATAPTEYIVLKTATDKLVLLTAERGGKWVACSKNDGNGSGGLPAFGQWREVYDTEKDALIGQIDLMLSAPNFYYSKIERTAMKDFRNMLVFEQLKLF